jgi:dipeptidase D
MSAEVRKLNPTALWNHFADLNAIPRPSKQESRIIAFMKKFGESLGLETQVDETGNVRILKAGTEGMEGRMPVILQSHLDMVHQKNADTSFDFLSQGIDMYVDGDWVKARGTTLGADNGIGVAAIMAVLASKDIPHPPLEALFTIDEETGMTGAKGLKGGWLQGKILLNLDTEEDHELTIGCAGGIDVTATGTYKQVPAAGKAGLKLMVKGLTGGHSGTDIHKGRGNANKLMNRLLLELSNAYSIGIASIDGGSLRNAIPRESIAEITVDDKQLTSLESYFEQYGMIIRNENQVTDPNLTVTMEKSELPPNVMDASFQKLLLRSVYACPNGIYRMSPSIAGLVQTSNNLARVLVKEGSYSIQCLTRSSVNTEKMDLAASIGSAFELAGASVAFSGDYPGWEPKPESGIVKLMSKIYQERFGSGAHVNAIHAGLECGIIGTNYAGMEMISFGPNIYGAHSPDERVQISSVEKFWGYLVEVLGRCGKG